MYFIFYGANILKSDYCQKLLIFVERKFTDSNLKCINFRLSTHSNRREEEIECSNHKSKLKY